MSTIALLCIMAQTVQAQLPGCNMYNAIDAGYFNSSESRSFIDYKNNDPANGFWDIFGQPSDEVWYKFTLSNTTQVDISLCGSNFDTYLYLVNGNGDVIESNDDNGPLCSGVQSSIQTTLSAGTYYVVAEGWSDNYGDIVMGISVTGSVMLPPLGANFSQNQNYIVTYTPIVSGLTDVSSYSEKGINDLNVQVQYFDGLGRPMQNVEIKGSPGLNDIVQPIAYDEYGRETKKYLPYLSSVNDGSYKADGITDQGLFYNSYAAKCAMDDRPYSETFFEASPLNRPEKQFGTGINWYTNNHSTNLAYQVNTPGEVKLWTISGPTVSATNSFYDAGTLYKTQTTDENGNKSWEYKDMQEKVVLKKVEDDLGTLDTYYVYDDYDRLAYVIPPKATNSSYTEGTSDFNELLYSYKYDDRSLMTEKHIPGAGWVNMVYNKLNQLILSQDAKQQSDGKWIFTKYDAFGRVVLTGIWADYGTRNDVQEAVNGVNETVLWESRDGSTYNYSNLTYPRTDYSNLLTINYYDDYEFNRDGKSFEAVSGYNTTASVMTKSLLTGSKVKVLDGSNTWLTDINYYDDKGRPIQAFSKNILNAWDRVTSLYDFSGKVMQSERTHNDNILTITNRYVYDHAGRKKEVYQQTGSNAEVELADYNYNELGQLVKKYLHGNSSNNLQGIDYRYNIRGWLTSINNAKLDNDGVLNEESNDAFGEELSYNTSLEAGNVTGSAQYNGNISGVKWKIKGPDVSSSSKDVNAYAFQYDKLNRMLLANYGSGPNGDTWNNEAGLYNEQLSYDEMGNIKTLQRKSTQGIIDNLTYVYKQNGISNQLASITDAGSNLFGFKKGNNSGDDYIYDVSGNLTQDKNKGLTIDYNILNLPLNVNSSVQSGTIGYTYDATGKKLKKTFSGQQDHYYFDGIEYQGTDFLFAMTEEGRVRLGTSGTYTYDYFLKDHLGNVRVVLSTDGTQRNSVYPAATMETMSAATESTYYTNLDKVRSFTPVGFKSIKKNEKVAHLKGTDPNKQIGPSITIKVNSGDTINLTAQSFYPDNTSTQRTGLAETALSQLVNAIVNPTGLGGKGRAIAIEQLKTQGLEKSTGYQSMMNKLPNSDYNNENNRPKAYMVWMLFDNEMKLVKTGKSSGARQIPEGAGQVKQMTENGIVMDQGGFLTAYTVNESPASVYIDNFQLSVASGGLLEENHYYPFGMLIDGLSKPGNNDPINNYKYNGKELQKELSLEWLDYGARFYDPVIGRWHSVDPKTEIYVGYSPYGYTNNDPILFTDPNGQDIWIYYGDDQRAQYKNGRLYNEDGSRYKGKDKFVSTVLGTLNKISSTDIGKEVVGELSGSKNDFNFTNTFAKDKEGNVVENALNFDKTIGGGGEIHAGAMMGSTMQEGQKIESSAHELFHGYQYETGQNPGTVNGEVGASLFGKAIVNQLGIGTSAFGKVSTVGSFYNNTMNAMMWDKKGFNYILYNQAMYNYIKGNAGNYNGDYNKFKIQGNDVNPAIKKFFPLVR